MNMQSFIARIFKMLKYDSEYLPERGKNTEYLLGLPIRHLHRREVDRFCYNAHNSASKPSSPALGL